MRSLLWIAVPVLVFGLVAVHETQAQSVGFFPSAIELENALRGQEYQTRTTLVNQDDEARIFTMLASGDTAAWTRFTLLEEPGEPVGQVLVPPESEAVVLVTVAVPDTAPNGAVVGKNAYDGYTEKAFESREGLVSGFEQPVRINVTGDQVIDLRVGDVSARNVEVGQPLRVTAALANQGNVDVKPDLTFDIYKLPGDAAADPLDTVSAELVMVPPGQSRTPSATWDTAGRAPGHYRADYVLSLDGERLALGSFEFALAPAGSVTPSGSIIAVDLVRPLIPGAVNRADVTFENTGGVPVRAHFTGHIYAGATALSEAATPDSLTVDPGEKVTLSAYFDLPEAEDQYELRGRAYFEGEQTDEVAVGFALGTDGETSVTKWLALGGLAVVAAGILAMSTAWFIRRRS